MTWASKQPCAWLSCKASSSKASTWLMRRSSDQSKGYCPAPRRRRQFGELRSYLAPGPSRALSARPSPFPQQRIQRLRAPSVRTTGSFISSAASRGTEQSSCKRCDTKWPRPTNFLLPRQGEKLGSHSLSPRASAAARRVLASCSGSNRTSLFTLPLRDCMAQTIQ